MQEVVTHEDSSLKQEEGKADAVPDDSRLPAGQPAFGVILSCGIKQGRTQEKMNTRVHGCCVKSTELGSGNPTGTSMEFQWADLLMS